MSYQFLTTKKYILGLLSKILFKEKIAKSSFPQFKGYSLIKAIKPQKDDDFNSVGLYADKNNKKVIIKHLQYSTNLLALYQLQNEASMLRLLETKSYKGINYSIKFPRLFKCEEHPGEIFMIMEFVQGELLTKFNKRDTHTILGDCLSAMLSITKTLDQSTITQLPIRTPLLMHLTLPLFFLLASLKEIKKIFFYLNLVVVYYKICLQSLKDITQYALAHKSLHLENIMVNKNAVTILDPQVCVYSEKLTDVSMTSIMYLEVIGLDAIKKLISQFISTDADRRSFLRLSIYFSIQNLALSRKQSEFYKESEAFLPIFKNTLQPFVKNALSK